MRRRRARWRDAVRLERHRLGPRLHLLGRRVHEYQAGLAILAVPLVGSVAATPTWPRPRVAALAGVWLVIKDWPDLFPATRDRASWRLGVHRLPAGG